MKILIIALIIDLMIGDNLGSFHPVVLTGRLIGFLENKFMSLPNKVTGKYLTQTAGVVLVLIVTFTAYFSSYFILRAVSSFTFVYLLLSAFLISTTFALRGLIVSGLDIFRALNNDETEKAKILLSKIVGRDTLNLSKAQIIKATIESLAENTIDGIIAPLFYAVLGGAPLAMLYRSINTLDSMVGYKNERYKNFGWAAAKLDDIANFLPARIGLLFMWLASLACKLNFKDTVKVSLRDGKKHLSPNSGLSEAAFAGALGIQIGGIAYYQGIERELPKMGLATNEISLKNLSDSLLLVGITTLLFFTASLIITAVIL